MLGALLDRLAGGRGAPAPAHKPTDRLPAELVAAIEGAAVFFRSGPDGDAVPVVRVPGLGMWKHEGLAETADRIGRAWPELTRRACLKAAELVAAQCGKRNWADMRGRPRRSWVWNWEL
ncbi:hypothetical protein ACTTAL_12745 [Rhodobacter capsulatus]|uniref:hypothetical protein n=1 Tax=Rhodobacter capsulatus TaxID=1061 RepID=UPI0003D2DDA7|nr:hypothetical protein [Rhodobacter capsulatus]ETD87904.1 hypothetical protein U713_16065 [Rhodobacter capsulatus YW2]